MKNLKIMPFKEKRELVEDNIAYGEKTIQQFISQEVGKEKALKHMESLRNTYAPITENITEEEKYETLYSNWIGLCRSNFSFIREHLGEEGVRRFVNFAAIGLIEKNKGPAVSFVNFFHKLSTKLAFNMIMKDMSYRLQWLTPYTFKKVTDHQAVFNIPKCKILQYDDVDDICNEACMKLYPQWVKEQFNLDMEFQRTGHKCTLTVKSIY